MTKSATDREKSRHSFDVLLSKIPFSVVEISSFYLLGREPLLSILLSIIFRQLGETMQNSVNITLEIKKIITVGFMGRGIVHSV